MLFSHDPNTCSPYRIYNYSIGKDTTRVTTGIGGLVWQQAAQSNIKPPKAIQEVGLLMEELLEKFANQPIDFEFAITKDDSNQKLWLLQVRPLILLEKPESDQEQTERLKLIYKKVASGISKHPFVSGKKTVYGVMPDWNPAEILELDPDL